MILFLSLYLLYVVEQFGINLFCLYSALVFGCFVVCNEPLCWFYLNCYVWLWSLWYHVLPFCLMNPKGEKNSLVQVLQLIFIEVADMIQMLKSAGTSILNLFVLPWHLCIVFWYIVLYIFGHDLSSKLCKAKGICLHQTGGDCWTWRKLLPYVWWRK